MLNQSILIQNLEMDLGYKFTDLEIDHDEILRIVKLRTLPEFSKYVPYQERVIVDATTDKVPNFNNRYYIKSENEILNVNNVSGINVSAAGSANWDLPVNTRTFNFSSQGLSIIDSQIAADIGSFSNPTTWMYYHPGMIEISPGIPHKMLVVCNVIHPDHLLTIPTNMQSVFTLLASLDVRMALYQMRNRFNNMQTTFGTLDLFVDDLSSAKDERNELVERLKLNSVKMARRRKIWIG